MKKLICAFGFALLASMPAAAHHNWAAGYYVNDPEIDIEGVLSSVTWTNPHIRMEVTVDQGKPTEKVWLLESTAVGLLSRMNLSPDQVTLGEKVKVAGWTARQSDHGLYMNHMLLPSGLELVFLRDAEPRWPEANAHVGDTDALSGRVVENDINKRPTSLFAVWNTIYGDPDSHSLTASRLSESEAIADAEKANRPPPPPEVDPDYSIETYECKINSMPKAMGSPLPIEFVKVDEDTIHLRLEQYDQLRIIYMTGLHDDVGVEPSSMGYSTGVWAGQNKLVVTTTKVVDSPAARYTETFEMRDDRNRVDYTRTTAGNASEKLTKYWQYVPGASIHPYQCTPELSR